MQRSPSAESNASGQSMLCKSEGSDHLSVFGNLEGFHIDTSEPLPPDVALRFQAAKALTWSESAMAPNESKGEEEGGMLATYPPTHARFSSDQLAAGAATSGPLPILASSPSEDRFFEYFGSPGSSLRDSPRSGESHSFGPTRSDVAPYAHLPHDVLSTTPEASSSAILSALNASTPTARVLSDHPVNMARPASVGPVKIHRRHKSAKRAPPPLFSAELLRAARQKMVDAQSVGGTLSPPATRLHHHSPASSTGSNTSVTSTQSDSSSLSGRWSPDTPPLPMEVWSCVFGFLPAPSLVELQSVCRAWHQICWETLKTLDMTGRAESQIAPSTWMAILPRCLNLKHLTISAHVPTDYVLELLSNSNLETLALHCHTTETSATGLFHIASMSKLTRLYLWMPRQIRPSALQPLIPHLGALTHFKAETLRQSFCERALLSLDSMTNLRMLDLSWCKRLSPSIFLRIAKLAQLEILILDMCGCDVTMGGISHLRVLPKLNDLSLKWCEHLSDAMLPTLATFPSLTKLDVSFCKHLTSTAIALWLPHVTVSLTIPHLIAER